MASTGTTKNETHYMRPRPSGPLCWRFRLLAPVVIGGALTACADAGAPSGPTIGDSDTPGVPYLVNGVCFERTAFDEATMVGNVRCAHLLK